MVIVSVSQILYSPPIYNPSLILIINLYSGVTSFTNYPYSSTSNYYIMELLLLFLFIVLILSSVFILDVLAF